MRRNRQAGQALALTAISLVVLVGMLGLGIDMGVLRYEKRLQQTAADAAAIAAASDLPYGGDAGAIAAADNSAAGNGFPDSGSDTGCGPGAGVETVCIQMHDPPSSGPHSSAGPGQYVEVLVSAVHPTYFARIFGKKTAAVTARAVATNVAGGPHKPCLLSLSTSATFVVDGTIQLTACDLIVNGNIRVNVPIQKDSASSIEVAGRCFGSCAGVVEGIPAVADPMVNLSAPPTDGCTGGGLLGLLDFLNFCQGTVGAGVNLDFTQLADPSSLYMIPGASGLTLRANADVNAPTETLYVPDGAISFPPSGLARVTAQAMIVGQPLDVTANVTLKLGGGGNSPIGSAVLVE